MIKASVWIGFRELVGYWGLTTDSGLDQLHPFGQILPFRQAVTDDISMPLKLSREQPDQTPKIQIQACPTSNFEPEFSRI